MPASESDQSKPPAKSQATDDSDRGAFTLRKLHSLSGVLFVSVTFLWQLWTHGFALGGSEALEAAVTGTHRAVIALALVPLAFHALYGLKLVLSSEYSLGRHPYSRNWMYALQRVTGMLALAFLGYHAYRFWIPLQQGAIAPAHLHDVLIAHLSTTTRGVPVAALGYMLGMAACAFHLANGMWLFCARWGIAVTRAARSGAAVVAVVIGVLTFGFGANTVVYLATGWRMVGTRAAPPPATLCAPTPSSSGGAPAPAPSPTGSAAAPASSP